jgi:hypothetical protein
MAQLSAISPSALTSGAIAVNEDDIKTMQSMVKEAINLFAKERSRANVTCFNETGVDWQLSLSEVPVTLKSQPSVKNCSANDAIFFMRMTEKAEDGRDKLDARVFMAPIMATKTGFGEVPYILNTWPAMRPRWQGAAMPDERSRKDEENLTSYLCWCLDSSSMSQMPGLDEDEGAAGGGDDEMNTASIRASQIATGVRIHEDDSDDEDD